MDIPTHIFLPLTLVYVLRSDFKAKHFPLALFAILPDFDILTGSIIFLAPLYMCFKHNIRSLTFTSAKTTFRLGMHRISCRSLSLFLGRLYSLGTVSQCQIHKLRWVFREAF